MKQRKIYRSVAVTLMTVGVLGLAGTNLVQAADITKLLEGCADCHEKDGNSTNADTPSIAGMSTEYFAESMEGYQTDARPAKKLKDKDDTMKDVVKNLSEGDIEALAEHYAKQKFKPYKQDFDAAKAKSGKKLHRKYCDKCHSEGGSSSEDDSGILAGQPMGYLRYSMDNYTSGKREMGEKMEKKVKSMLKKDGDASIDLLLHYYASQQ